MHLNFEISLLQKENQLQQDAIKGHIEANTLLRSNAEASMQIIQDMAQLRKKFNTVSSEKSKIEKEKNEELERERAHRETLSS